MNLNDISVTRTGAPGGYQYLAMFAFRIGRIVPCTEMTEEEHQEIAAEMRIELAQEILKRIAGSGAVEMISK